MKIPGVAERFLAAHREKIFYAVAAACVRPAAFSVETSAKTAIRSASRCSP